MNDVELLQAISEIFDKKLEPVCQRLDDIAQRLEVVEQRLEVVEQRLDVVEQRVDVVEQKIKSVKKIIRIEIHKSEKIILSEVERVHSILELHMKDKTKHTAWQVIKEHI